MVYELDNNRANISERIVCSMKEPFVKTDDTEERARRK